MTKLCPRGKAAAKRKFKVYPSAYANAYASKICAGKIKDPSGTKRKDFKGPKPAGAKDGKMISRDQRQKEIRKKQNPISEYDKKGKLKYTAAKKGKAMMIIIGIGKKKKVDKKMMGGMPTAGAMAGVGRLQKAQMKKGGGADTGTLGTLRSTKVKDKFPYADTITDYYHERPSKGIMPVKSLKESQVGEGRSKAKKVIKKLKNFKNQSKGFLKEMTGFQKGGGADYMNTVKSRKRGNPAVVGSPPKKRSGGGMVRGFGAAIRGKNFEGVF